MTNHFFLCGVLATLWTGEGLVQACPQGQAVDTLLAVIMTARKHLGLLVVLVTDSTRDLFFQIPHTRTFSFSHFSTSYKFTHAYVANISSFSILYKLLECMCLQPFSAHLEHIAGKKRNNKSYYRFTTLIV